jgi:pSer/pThr/pTyr-binding forkhead associated (FHA) protein
MTELLFIEQAPSEGAQYPLEPGSTIGREGCDIVLSDPDVSRRHAAIQVVGTEVSIEDLGSTNGTYVNGQRIDSRHRLGDGDEVQIGSVVLRLRAPASATRLVETPTGATRLSQTTTLRPSGEPEPSATEQAPMPEPFAPEPAPVAEQAPMPEPPVLHPPAPEPPAPEPPAPEPAPAPEPPAARPAGGAGRRGDVPLPDFQPSAIRRVVPGPDAPTAFTPETRGRRGSAATRVGATVISGAVVALTTAGVLIYYITEPFK